MEQECASDGVSKIACPTSEPVMNSKYRRLVDFDGPAWSVLIRLKVEMEDRQNRIRVSISDVVNTVLKAQRYNSREPQIAEKIRAELLKLWSIQPERLSEFQRGFEAGLICALQSAR